MTADTPSELSLSQAPTMQHPKRWPLVNTLTSRGNDFTQDSRIVNGYAEKNPLTGDYSVEKRPGFSPAPVATGAGGEGKGIYSVAFLNTVGGVKFFETFTLFITADSPGSNSGSAYGIFTTGPPSPPTLLGPVQLGRNGAGLVPPRVQFMSFQGAGTLPTVVFGTGVIPPLGVGPSAYYYDDTGLNSLNPGTNNFPDRTVSGFVYLNGFVYVMDYLGVIWQTLTQNQVANWDPLAFITAATEADLGVQLTSQLVYVVAIKTWTTQFFYDAGNTVGSSLSPLPGAVFDFGCLSADTFAEMDGVLFWATQSKQGVYRIVVVKDLREEFISNPAVERQLELGPGSVWYSTAYQHAGHRWYLITNLTTNVTMVYDIGEKLWYLWTDYQGNYYPVVSRASSARGKEWHQMGPTGSVYELDADYVYPNDATHVVPVDIYTPNFDDGVDREKFLNQMRFNADQTKGSSLLVRFSDDDYKTWSSYRTVDLGHRRPFIQDEGSFYRRAYHFRHYANTKFRIRSVDLTMDRGVF